ncbi:MAG TPA: dihydropteroate synthase, partial [Pusillimonas sp.]|nr:dihydropteroate synthase [Pusillimonas sp.]
HITGRQASQRLGGSVAGALAGVARGAKIVRVHDVAPTLDPINVWQAIENGIEE